MSSDPKRLSPHFDRLAEELDKCIRCGQCRTVCPVFADLRREKYAARGKIALTKALLQGNLTLSPGYREVIDNCLLCMACFENCASGVRLDRVVTALRAEIAERKGLGIAKTLAFRLVLAHREFMALLLAGGSVAQYLLYKSLPRTSGLRLRFPVRSAIMPPKWPALVHTPFRRRLPETVGASTSGRRVVFFSGCLINHVAPAIGESLLRVMGRLDTAVSMPRRQGCCGAPAEANGDLKTVRKLARNNLIALDIGRHEIVTACASGGHMLKAVYPTLFEAGDPFYRRARTVAQRTYDISEYLVQKIGLAVLMKHLRPYRGADVTYHDPCHLNRGQQVSAEPRRLLSALCGDRFIEMSAASRCCGSAGTYGLTHPHTASHILNIKTDAIRASGARTVVTGCPGCIIQLQNGADAGWRTLHLLEFIAMQLQRQQTSEHRR